MDTIKNVLCKTGDHTLRIVRPDGRGYNTEASHMHHLGMDNRGFMQWGRVCVTCKDAHNFDCQDYLDWNFTE